MAKVIRGARRSKDPQINYSICDVKTSKYPIRRSADPENYKHSRSEKVKRTRETFARAMVRYSRMDIVTKQMYQEAVRMRAILPLELPMRKIIDEIKKRIERQPPGPPPLPVPSYLINESPYTQINISPNPIPSPQEYINWIDQYLPKEISRGHEQIIQDEYGRERMPDPSRNPLPTPIPDEEKNINKDRTPDKSPIYISVEIDPSGLTGFLYEGYVWVKTEYGEVKRWIKSHKKEVIIIVAIGTIVLFGWYFTVGGGLVTAGKEVLVKAGAVTPEVRYALGVIGLPWTEVRDWYYKRIVLEWAENLDIWAWNDSKSWQCYKEVVKGDNDIMFNFYEGPDADHKGLLAAWVRAEIDFENKTASLDYGCGESKDRIVVFLNGAQWFKCNIGGIPFDMVDLYNATKGVWGEAKTSWDGRTRIWAFEDRPVFGDGDYNDAYVYVTYDENWQPIMIRAREGEHCDELYIYWRGNLIAHFPRRC